MNESQTASPLNYIDALLTQIRETWSGWRPSKPGLMPCSSHFVAPTNR